MKRKWHSCQHHPKTDCRALDLILGKGIRQCGSWGTLTHWDPQTTSRGAPTVGYVSAYFKYTEIPAKVIWHLWWLGCENKKNNKIHRIMNFCYSPSGTGPTVQGNQRAWWAWERTLCSASRLRQLTDDVAAADWPRSWPARSLDWRNCCLQSSIHSACPATPLGRTDGTAAYRALSTLPAPQRHSAGLTELLPTELYPLCLPCNATRQDWRNCCLQSSIHSACPATPLGSKSVHARPAGEKERKERDQWRGVSKWRSGGQRSEGMGQQQL